MKTLKKLREMRVFQRGYIMFNEAQELRGIESDEEFLHQLLECVIDKKVKVTYIGFCDWGVAIYISPYQQPVKPTESLNELYPLPEEKIFIGN